MPGQFHPPADRVLVGGKIITVNPGNDVVDALAIKGNRIAAVGSRAEIEPFIGPETQVINLDGRSALPGFIDNHIHLVNGIERSWIDMRAEVVSSIEEIKELVAQRVKETPPGQWIFGARYYPQRLLEGRHPTRHDLDAVAPDHPVGLKHRSAMAWTFNTMGLRRIGVSDDTPDPPGGPMERDEAGVPLGPMFDNTRTVFISPNTPAPTVEERVEGYRWLCKELNRHGITSAVESSIRSRDEVLGWGRLREQGELTLRVNLGPYPIYGADWDPNGAATKMFEAGLYTGFGDEWVKIGSLTYGVDGDPMGPHSALFEPYSNDPKGQYRGSFRATKEVADAFSRDAHVNGWQISAVCFGDHGLTVAVDAIEQAQRAVPGRHLRHRLEHAHLWNESLLRRAAELGIIWNFQPALMAGLGRWGTIDAWGPRSRWGFPVKSALEHGIVVSAGSDWPVDSLDPMVGIDALVTRRLEPLEQGDVLNPNEAVSVLEAIRMYTYNSAYTCFEEGTKGSLEVGKLADVAVLSDDILAVPIDRIREIRAVLTILDGNIIYQDPGLPA